MFNTGKRNFNTCQNNTVEYVRYAFPEHTQVTHWESGQISQKLVAGETPVVKVPRSQHIRTGVYAGTKAILHCPRTEDEKVTIESDFSNHGSDVDAFENLRYNAGRLVCKGCRFAAMTPQEVSEDRRQTADLEILRRQTQAELESLRKKHEI